MILFFRVTALSGNLHHHGVPGESLVQTIVARRIPKSPWWKLKEG
jgi:hypothetical protein